MSNIIIKATNLKTKEVITTDNFYFFEEEGIMNINNDGTCSNLFGEELKIEFIKEEEVKNG